MQPLYSERTMKNFHESPFYKLVPSPSERDWGEACLDNVRFLREGVGDGPYLASSGKGISLFSILSLLAIDHAVNNIIFILEVNFYM